MDLILILAASFFYFASPMLVTPLITGFAESVGASAALMGMIGGLMNLCALFCRPIAGNLADKISKYKLSFLGAGLMALSCLGYMRDDQCYFLNASLAVHTTASRFDVSGLTELPRVDILYFYAGAPADALDFYASRARGLVIAGTGSGNYSPQWVEKIRQLSRLCIPVVRSSRIGHGIVSRDPHFEGSDNCIPAYTLPPQKARILLSLALTVTDSYAEIEEIFRKY